MRQACTGRAGWEDGCPKASTNTSSHGAIRCPWRADAGILIDRRRDLSAAGASTLPHFATAHCTQREEPVLATSWQRIDARTLELALREDARIHDGWVMKRCRPSPNCPRAAPPSAACRP
jgi:hypothetical protein